MQRACTHVPNARAGPAHACRSDRTRASALKAVAAGHAANRRAARRHLVVCFAHFRDRLDEQPRLSLHGMSTTSAMPQQQGDLSLRWRLHAHLSPPCSSRLECCACGRPRRRFRRRVHPLLRGLCSVGKHGRRGCPHRRPHTLIRPNAGCEPRRRRPRQRFIQGEPLALKRRNLRNQGFLPDFGEFVTVPKPLHLEIDSKTAMATANKKRTPRRGGDGEADGGRDRHPNVTAVDELWAGLIPDHQQPCCPPRRQRYSI
jgi:hypothetical protein